VGLGGSPPAQGMAYRRVVWGVPALKTAPISGYLLSVTARSSGASALGTMSNLFYLIFEVVRFCGHAADSRESLSNDTQSITDRPRPFPAHPVTGRSPRTRPTSAAGPALPGVFLSSTNWFQGSFRLGLRLCHRRRLSFSQV